MTAKRNLLSIALMLATLVIVGPSRARAQAVAEPAAGSAAKGSSAKGSNTKESATKLAPVQLAGGALTVDAPVDWRRVKPRNRIIEVELAVSSKPAAEQGSGSEKKGSGSKNTPARLTIMSAGGSVDANLSRWIGQFQGTGAGAAREKAAIDKRQVAGMTLHTLDISGTYMDSMRGPFGPKTPKPDHRMLAGILQTKDRGNYFFKLIGPSGVVGPNATAFAKMLDSADMKGSSKVQN